MATKTRTSLIYQTGIAVLGNIEIVASDTYIFAINFTSKVPSASSSPNAIAQQCYNELDEYFKGKRTVFTIQKHFKYIHEPRDGDDDDYEPTEFQRTVWGQLLKIPFGETMSYGGVAKAYEIIIELHHCVH